ncbi:MAG: hypothetical protein IJ532_08845 [Alphaproteobacteria bacterium]|nr:hypothetical protein [Alphaproteobacteria bacterium]
MKTFIKCFLNDYVLVLLVATIALAYGFYQITPMLSSWWQQALAILGVLALEDVLAFVISWRIIFIWKRSSFVYDTRIIGIAGTFYACYISSGIFVGIYAWMTDPWMFLTTVALVVVFGLLGVGIVNAPYHTMKKFDGKIL